MNRVIVVSAFLITLTMARAQLRPDSWSAGTPVKIPTGGVMIDGMFFKAADDGMTSHPTMIYFHGLPGFAGDLDLPMPVSRAGWNVLTLHYRGSWGSPGDYSYAHQIEDAQAAIEFVRKNPNADSRIVITGHSTGGLIALITAVNTPGLAGLILISASDDAAEAANKYKTQAAREALQNKSSVCSPPLFGCTSGGLDLEVLNHAPAWSFAALAQKLRVFPVLMITSNDPYAAENDELRKAIAAHWNLTPPLIRLKTNHAYANQRAALAVAVTGWLHAVAFPPIR